MVLVGQRRAEERHDPVAHDLVDGALVAVDGLHHPLEDRVEELPRLLGVAVGQQLHRALQVGEEDRDLLALAFQGGLGGEDLLGEVLGRVATQGSRIAEPEPARQMTRLGAPHSGQNFALGDSWPTALGARPGRAARRIPRRTRARRRSRAWHRGHVMAVEARLRPDRSRSYRQAQRAA